MAERGSEFRFGKMIRELREKSGNSMQKLADVLGTSVVYISDIERGRRNPPSGEKLWKIADFLGISRKEVEIWAHKERKRVELELGNLSSPVSEAALTLARRWEDITDEEATAIINLLTKETQYAQERNGTKGTTTDEE